MAPPTNQGYQVNPDELYSHARAVAQMQQPLDRVVAATKEVCPDGISVAYGTICQPFAMTLSPVQGYAEEVVGKISRSIDSAANELIKVVDTYVDSDTQNSRQLRSIGANLPSNAGNGLIAKGTQWDWKNYNPVDGGPLTNMDAQNGGKGGGIVGNTWELVVEIKDSSKQNYGAMVGHITSVGADAASLVGDPLGTAVSGLAGWVMEHIKPFKLILDGLAGNPDMIKSASLTWKNLHAELNRLAEHYEAAVKHGAGGWDGKAGQSYRENTAKNVIDSMRAAANLAQVMSVVVGTTGELVNLVRTAARDITAQAIGMLAVAAAKFYKPPFEQLSQVQFHLKNLKQLVTFLIVFVGHFAKQIPLVIEAFKTVANTVPKLNGV